MLHHNDPAFSPALEQARWKCQVARLALDRITAT